MRQYLEGKIIHVTPKVYLMRFLMIKPSALNGRLAKWAIYLSQYDMEFLPQKTIKGQALVDFLADNLTSKAIRMYKGLPDEVVKVFATLATFDNQVWQLYFDGVSQTSPNGNLMAGVGVVLVSP